MAYHIDLLLDEERRSPSTIQIYKVLRIVAITATLILLTVGLLLFLKEYDMAVQLHTEDERWQLLAPQEADLQHVRSDLSGLRATARQLHDFSQTRVLFGQELAWLQQGVPPAIQLTSLRVAQTINSPSGTVHAARCYELRLSGQVSSEEAEKDVSRLLAYMGGTSRSGRIESVVIPPGAFRPTPAHGAAGGDREFEVLCRYRARSFE